MITEARIKQYLQKIQSSQEFSESRSYSELLSYLVESSIKGQFPKETTIAMDVFHKKLNIEHSSETNVRVYVHNLRKKLDSYYLNEGKEDAITLNIPKGRYEVKFLKKDNQKKTRYIKLVAINILALLILTLINIPFFKKNTWIDKNKGIPDNSPVWSNFLQKNRTTQIVFGDWYVFVDYSTYENDDKNSLSDVFRRHRYIRDPEINSKKDLEEFLSSENSGNLVIRETEHTYTGKFTTWCLYEMFPVFINHNVRIELKLSSKLLWEDLNKYNTIYIGSYKSFGLLKEIVQNLHTKYTVFPNSIDFYDSDKDTTYSYRSLREYESGYHQDYTLIAKIPGPSRNTIMIFSSTGDIGHISSVQYFTAPESLKEFERTYLKGNPEIKYFEAIMEVKGYERIGMSTKVLHFKSIDHDYIYTIP